MSILTGISTEILQARLAAAQTAYLDLCAGAQTVSVKMGDMFVQFTPTSIPALREHIRELQAATGQSSQRVQGVYLAGGKGL